MFSSRFEYSGELDDVSWSHVALGFVQAPLHSSLCICACRFKIMLFDFSIYIELFFHLLSHWFKTGELVFDIKDSSCDFVI